MTVKEHVWASPVVWLMVGGLIVAFVVLGMSAGAQRSEKGQKPARLIHHLDPTGFDTLTEEFDGAGTEVEVSNGPNGRPIRTLRKGNKGDTMDRGVPKTRKAERRASARPKVKVKGKK